MAPATVSDLMALLRAEGGAAAPSAPAELPPPKTQVELDPAMREVIKAFEDAKALCKFASEQKDALDEQIRNALGGADIGTIGGHVVVKVNASHNSHLDSATVREGWPECYEAAVRRTDYTYLSTKSTRGLIAGA